MTALVVSRVSPVQTAIRNCTRDEGRPSRSAEVLISSHRSCRGDPTLATPHGAIIALQHPDTALVWLGSKTEVTALQQQWPVHLD